LPPARGRGTIRGIVSGEPDTLKGVRPVRRGADGKGRATGPRQRPTLHLAVGFLLLSQGNGSPAGIQRRSRAPVSFDPTTGADGHVALCTCATEYSLPGHTDRPKMMTASTHVAIIPRKTIRFLMLRPPGGCVVPATLPPVAIPPLRMASPGVAPHSGAQVGGGRGTPRLGSQPKQVRVVQ
jgi:hypothetical protein